MPSNKKRVIVVGGGFAGLRALRELPGCRFDVTLVDCKDHFENVPAALRSLVEPAAADSNLVTYPKSIARVHGRVVGVTSDGKAGEVELEGGDKLPFDYCLLATGSAYAGRFIKPDPSKLSTKEARLVEFEQAHSEIQAAGSVVIVGAGSVGVELAAEIAEAMPGKKMMLVTSTARVLSRMAPAASKHAAQWLEAHGVELVHNEKIADWGGLGAAPGPATLTTASGRTISGDWVIKAVGIRPATTAFAAALGQEQLASNGALMVEPTLQVKGWPNVFAAGDVTSIAEEKTAVVADLAGLVAARNIERLDKGEALQSYWDLYGGYDKLPFAGGVTLGKADGVMEMAGDMQSGRALGAIWRVVEAVVVRAAAGSWFFGKLSNGMKGIVVSKLKAAAKKQAAAAGAVSGDKAGAGVEPQIAPAS